MKLFASVCAAAALALGAASTAGAQQQADGLVVVQIGDVTLTDTIDVAAAAAVQACGINVGPLSLAVLGQALAVDRSGRARTICEVDGQDVVIRNN